MKLSCKFLLVDAHATLVLAWPGHGSWWNSHVNSRLSTRMQLLFSFDQVDFVWSELMKLVLSLHQNYFSHSYRLIQMIQMQSCCQSFTPVSPKTKTDGLQPFTCWKASCCSTVCFWLTKQEMFSSSTSTIHEWSVCVFITSLWCPSLACCLALFSARLIIRKHLVLPQYASYFLPWEHCSWYFYLR